MLGSPIASILFLVKLAEVIRIQRQDYYKDEIARTTVKYYKEIEKFSKGKLFSHHEIKEESSGWTSIDSVWYKSIEKQIQALVSDADTKTYEVDHLESLFYDVFGILEAKVQEGYLKDHAAP